MDFAFCQCDGIPAVTMSGRFLYADAPKIHDIVDHWNFAEFPSVLVDLRFVTFIDSTAIGMLFVLARAAQKAGGTLRLFNPTPGVRRTLQRADVGSRAEIAETDRITLNGHHPRHFKRTAGSVV